MLELLRILVIGLIEGVTEFLPISSTGHLIVAVSILQPALSAGARDTFEIFIQFGAVVAVVAYFWRDLVAKARALPHDRGTQRFVLALAVACVPAAAIGFVFRDAIKATFFNPLTVAITLIAGGVVLIAIERVPAIPARASGGVDFSQVSLRRAIGIGVLQTLALIPGVSRSAAAIVGGMAGGLNRETATAFSFYLAIPILGGATLLELVLSLDALAPSDMPYFLLGALVSGIVAWVSIRWLLRYVSTHTFIPFGIYRILAGAALLILIAAGWQL